MVYIVLLFTGSLSKPPAAAYAQRASSTLSTIPAGLVDIGTVAPSQSGTSQRSRFEICPSWQIRHSSLELCLTPQAITHRAEVSDPANYITQPNTVSCGKAAPTSRVFHTPPKRCTVSDEKHRPAQRVNLFMSTGNEPLLLNQMCHNVQHSLVVSDRTQALNPDHTGMSEGQNRCQDAVGKTKTRLRSYAQSQLWGSDAVRQFKDLRSAIVERVTLSHPDRGKALCMRTDAS
jgi:hypothetical protein